MSHHGHDSEQFMRDMIAKQLDRETELRRVMKEIGPTKNHPDGKMTANDEGGLKMVVMATEGKVTLAFGSEVAWIGFNPEDARNLAKTLTETADRAEQETEDRLRKRGEL